MKQVDYDELRCNDFLFLVIDWYWEIFWEKIGILCKSNFKCFREI